MIKPNVPDEWSLLAYELLADLIRLRETDYRFSTLAVDSIKEVNGKLRVLFYFVPDVDELYEVIMNIIKYYENLMQATSFTKTSNIQGNTGGICSAF